MIAKQSKLLMLVLFRGECSVWAGTLFGYGFCTMVIDRDDNGTVTVCVLVIPQQKVSQLFGNKLSPLIFNIIFIFVHLIYSAVLHHLRLRISVTFKHIQQNKKVRVTILTFNDFKRQLMTKKTLIRTLLKLIRILVTVHLNSKNLRNTCVGK